MEAAIVAIYNRHRQHIWSEHSISQAEEILDRAGLYQRASRTPAICFVDLTGYTRLTEEQGDEVAARLASNLATLVEDIFRRRGGRPIRWLGAGEVVTSEETVEQVERSEVRFEWIGLVELKGVARPVMLYRANRRDR